VNSFLRRFHFIQLGMKVPSRFFGKRDVEHVYHAGELKQRKACGHIYDAAKAAYIKDNVFSNKIPIATFCAWCYTLSEITIFEVKIWYGSSCLPTGSWCV